MTAPPTPRDPRTHLTRKGLFVWAVSILIYLVAIVGRTSFGVAAVDAIDRFSVDGAHIALFTSVQIGVYAVAQIPTGMAIDRFGPRRLLVIGALIMAIGQATLALTTSYPIALIARVFIGAGDATAFLSAMRILPFWFPLRHAPIFAQLTGAIGQLGQIISAIPFLALLHARGWTVAFLSLGAAGVLVAIAGWVAVADSPHGAASAEPAPTASRRRGAGRAALAYVLRSPVCWYGFFIHWSSMVMQFTFTLLWGLPLMTLGMGLSPHTAGLVLTVNTAVLITASPLHGMLSSRLGLRRDVLVFTLTAALTLVWVGVLLPTHPWGAWAVIVLNIILAITVPASNYAFDYVREGLDRSIVATGTGLANMGGFTAAMISAQVIGWLLDHLSGPRLFEWQDFRIALWTVVVVWACGMIGMALLRGPATRRVRERLRLASTPVTADRDDSELGATAPGDAAE